MVLETTPMESIFKTSNGIGVGMGANARQQILDDNDLSGFKSVIEHWETMSDTGNEYIQVQFNDAENDIEFNIPLRFSKWAAMGNSGIIGDGRVKISYLDMRTAQFVEWATDIPIPKLGLSNWTEYQQDDVIVTTKLRLTQTTPDSYVAWVARIRAIY